MQIPASREPSSVDSGKSYWHPILGVVDLHVRQDNTLSTNLEEAQRTVVQLCIHQLMCEQTLFEGSTKAR